MAALAGAEFNPIPINQQHLAENFADAILQSETFCVNAHGVAKFLLSKAVREAGYKVVITGEGSDEILGGYAHFGATCCSTTAKGRIRKRLRNCWHG